ncbi:hypothetical protein AWR38_14560 [Idiomarina sp. WRN-38]|uniref:replication endonuclease n=1 Tax=Idiomarina sp. OXR-189 TaxID=3100175 RepID=UPI0007336427|nr:replication endonuclease [Idiomarina sp. OXR-189]KTG27614.1 hypothetical protein AUR68_14545 [Idiomarina sp. H105]OAF04600.1 hypothetical protein AWR38_14560 [Idiomarina sp. WRN-38]WPZ00935.1 replication endonuclease [Idiomarina sp. OXR-189]|tara:strand:- start:4359 stop:5831 length:1473 start_codon:yes stop_codon:yes gene_type:complete
MLNDAQKKHYSLLYPELADDIEKFDIGSLEYFAYYLYKLPQEFSSRLRKAYFKHPTIRESNIFIRDLSDKIFSDVPTFVKNLNADQSDIRLWANQQSENCLRMMRKPPYTYTGKSNKKISYTEKRQNIEKLYTGMASYTRSLNLEPPKPNSNVTIEGCIKRMTDASWWMRRIKTSLKQAREFTAINLNIVSKNRDIYCSTLTARARQTEKAMEKEFLKNNFRENENGERVSLFDLSQPTVANPVNRRHEMMTRIRGFENHADKQNHEALFLTLTCPSKYHNNYAKSGMANPKWMGSTPKQAQNYLTNVWARIRAKLNRNGIMIYGMRVVEPQHDGTPHWHLLVFLPRSQVEDFSRIFRHYALLEDGNESGAQENRCDITRIDKSKGSASGYIAKYVAKNIDGAHLETGTYGESVDVTVMHVEAWASCWSIRQFQQQGGPPVSPYRELRRVRHEQPEDSPFEAPRLAADKGDWCGYIGPWAGYSQSAKTRN